MTDSDNASAGRVRSVAVVGGGVSGLVASYKLRSNGIQVTLFEANERAGGRIRSNSQHGFIWDEGANTMTESEEDVGNLISNLGLREKQQFPISQNKRYITKNGVPEMIPSNPVSLIKSSFISTKSKLRVMFEPIMWKSFAARSYGEYSVESVGQFFERHFGKEVVDLLIDPFVAGTSGGDPNSLSMRHSFPEIWNLEKKYGSIIIGAMRSKLSEIKNKNAMNEMTSEKKNRRLSFSFQGGMQTLTDALCSKIGEGNLKLSSKVFSLACSHDETSQFHKWSVFYNSCQANQKEYPLNQAFDAVIMTAPLCNVQEMKFEKEGSPLKLNFLPKVSYVPMSVLITSFKKQNVERPLEGFGVLVPSREKEVGLKTLGTLFSSMMFPERAPSDQYLYTTFVGGSRDKDLAGASFEELKQVVVADLQKLLGVNGQPTFVKHIYWKDAFPLYGHDYDSVIEGINKLEESLPGFFYAGNHRDGLAVGKAISSGCKAADRVLSYLNTSF